MFPPSNTKCIIFLLIFFYIGNKESLQTSDNNNIDIFHYNANEKHSNANIGEPKENLNVRECVSEKGNLTNTIKCRCNINYPNEISLIRDKYGWWVRRDKEFNCTDVNNTNTTKVDFAHTESTEGVPPPVEKCKKPQERLEFFHSCLDTTYPRSETKCFCTYNYPQPLHLKCRSGGWAIVNYPEKCKGSRKPTDDNKTDHVDLSNFGNENSTIKCSKPEELLNIFHSCEEKGYPASNTSCKCTYNRNSKIHFVCSNDEYTKGLIWYRRGYETPCKYNLNPLLVHCYRNNEKEIICNCRKNCFNLDITANLSYSKINQICNDETTYLPESELEINYNISENILGFKCTEGYELFGNKELTCNKGILNGTLPKCYNGTLCDNDYENVTHIALYLTMAVLVIDIIVIIFFIVHFCLKLKNTKETKNTTEEIGLDEIRAN